MKSLRSMVLALLFLILLTTAPNQVSAAKLNVSATIEPWINFSSTLNVDTYEVTGDDIACGYVDIENVLNLKYKTNVPDSIHFELVSLGRERLLVPGGGNSLRVTGGRPGVPQQGVFDLRIILTKNISEGTRPLMLMLIPVGF